MYLLGSSPALAYFDSVNFIQINHFPFSFTLYNIVRDPTVPAKSQHFVKRLVKSFLKEAEL